MFDPQYYSLAIGLFLQLLGVIYFFSFGAYIFQVQGLFGTNGILPIKRFLHIFQQRLKYKRFYYIPSIFWLNSSDKMLIGVIWVGVMLSVLLVLKIWIPLILVLLFILHLSIVSTGQDFLSFGWEHFLLEVTFNAFLLSLTSIANPFVWISINLLLFRFHLQGGAVKIQSGDKNWRNLTALAYHYESQPIPNTQAWYAHKLPLWFHKFSTALMFIIELIVPFGILFGTEEIRLIVYLCLLGLQFTIWLTGNFSYLNYLTVVLCTILVGNSYLQPIFGTPLPTEPSSIELQVILSITGIVLIVLQLMNIWHHLIRPNKTIYTVLSWFQPFHIVNRYGIFAVMTTNRYEVIVEGSDDGVIWKEYTFYYKPSETSRRPRRISPYQPRIDWQVWFLPFSYYESELWFQNFLYQLLKGSKPVLKLLRGNPFPNTPPKYVRASLYEYKFSDFKTKKEFGVWWERRFINSYSPTLELKP